MKLAVLIAGLAFFAAMTWAVSFHFRSARKPLPFVLLSLASVANIAVFAHVVWRRPQDPWLLASALALFVFAGALFWAAASASRSASLKLLFDKSEPGGLLEAGPYRYIRHPFYASYILFWSGCALATLHWFNIAYAVLLIPLLAWGARTEEQSFAQSQLATAYEQYRQRAGLFWPLLRPSR